LQMLAGLTRRSTADIDSSRPDFDGDTRRGFYGALLSVQAADQHRPFVYGLVQQDRNSDRTRVELILDPDGIPGNADDVNTRTRHAYDSHYVGFGSTGNLGDRIAYAAEFVYQGGEGLSASFDRNIGIPIAQTDERIEAYAMDLKIDYLFQDPNRTRAVGEVLLASGDDDRLHTTNTVGGNRRGSTDRAFNAFGLVNTGLAFAPPSSNLLMFRGGLATFPLPASTWFDRLQLGATFYSFFKLDREAPIDQATSKDAYLGFEVDLFANWQIASDVTLSLQYGVFLPGHAIAADHDARHFLVTSVTYSF